MNKKILYYGLIISGTIHLVGICMLLLHPWNDLVLPSTKLSPAAEQILQDPNKNLVQKTELLVKEFFESLHDPNSRSHQKLQKELALKKQQSYALDFDYFFEAQNGNSSSPTEDVAFFYPKDKEGCDDQNSITGIGLKLGDTGPDKMSPVKQVAPGSPAEKIGVRVGDKIEGYPLRFQGPIGSSVKVEFFRDGRKFSKTAIREKVCYHKKKTQPKTINPAL